MSSLDATSGARVLDLGCGTGTLALALVHARPDLDVVGLDADGDALVLARAKGGAELVEFHQGLAQALPFNDASFEVVVSSLMFHHLLPATKRASLTELRRVLVPGGRMLVADFGRADGVLRRLAFNLVRLLDGAENTRDHALGRFPGYLVEAGFVDVELHDVLPVMVGSIDLIRARNPGGG